MNHEHRQRHQWARWVACVPPTHEAYHYGCDQLTFDRTQGCETGRQGRLVTAQPCAAFEISPETLAAALEGRVLQVYYHPIVACGSGALVGFEALARWPHPDLGMVMPHQFIPIAEQSGLTGPLVRQLMEEALSWFSESFQDTATTITLNLSALLLSDLQLSDWLSQCCSRLAIDPRQIILAIPESDAIRSQSSTVRLAMQLRLHGFLFCISNFGVGFSSLRQLAQLPFSELKIDKSIVRQAPVSETSREVIARVIGLSRAVGLHITANGVEDEWTLDFLRTKGCDAAHGSWIAPQLDGPATLAWCRSQAGRRDKSLS